MLMRYLVDSHFRKWTSKRPDATPIAIRQKDCTVIMCKQRLHVKLTCTFDYHWPWFVVFCHQHGWDSMFHSPFVTQTQFEMNTVKCLARIPTINSIECRCSACREFHSTHTCRPIKRIDETCFAADGKANIYQTFFNTWITPEIEIERSKEKPVVRMDYCL